MGKLKNWFRPTNVIAAVLAFLAAYYFLPRYFIMMFTPLPYLSQTILALDASWNLHLDYAHIKGLNWGTDIIFTYGPLAYLAAKASWAHNSIDFLLYDFFIFLNFFLVFFVSFRESTNKIATAIFIILLCILYPKWLGTGGAIMLMAFLVFWVRRSLDNPKPILYIFQIVLIVLAFFVKFNTALIVFPLFFAGIAYNIFRNRKDSKTVFLLGLTAVLPVIFIILLSKVLNVSLFAYIHAGIEIIAGYNDIMYLDHPMNKRIMAFIIIAIPSSVLIYQAIMGRKANLYRNGTILFLFGTAIFILYKQGFVRGMEVDFFTYSGFIIFCVSDFHIQKKKLMGFVPLLPVAVAIFVVSSMIDLNQLAKDKFDNHYWEQYNQFTPTLGLQIYPNKNTLPDEIRQKVGTQTIDAYPWNLQTLIENKMNYSPRPVFQAYTAYTKYLENLNFEFYNDPQKAPQFIMYEFGTLDWRYALYDESKLNLVFYKNYQVDNAFEFQGVKYLLLEKKKDFSPIRLTKIKEYEMPQEGKLIPQPDTYYEVEFKRKITGDIVAALDHSPEIEIGIEGHSMHQSRTSGKLLESGIFGTSYISTTDGFADYLNGKQSTNVEPVKSFTFIPKNRNYFKSAITITEYKISR